MPLHRLLVPAFLLVLSACTGTLRGAGADDPVLRDRLPELMRMLETGGHNDRLAALTEIAAFRLPFPDVAARVRPLLDDPAADVARAAADTLAAMGESGIGELLDALQSHDGYTRRLAVTALAAPSLNRRGTVDTLVARIARLLDDPDRLIRRATAVTLLALWPRSEPALTGAMKRGDQAVRDAVVNELMIRANSHYPQAAANVQPFVSPEINETYADFEEQVAGDLLKRMNSSVPVESDIAFDAMRRLQSGKSRNLLVAALIRAMQDENLQRYRPETIRKLELVTNGFVPAWFDGISSTNRRLRKLCVKALMERLELRSDERILAAMSAALGDPDVEIRREALEWTSSLAEVPRAMIAKVAGMLTGGNDLFDSDDEYRGRAAALLGKWAAEPKTSVPALIGALDETAKPSLQMAAIVALRSFGTGASAAVSRLAPFLTNDNVELRRAAAETFVALGPEGGRAAAGYLIDVLRSSQNSPSLRLWAVRNLAAAGPQAAAAAPDLTALLADSPNDLRIEVAHALGEIGPQASSAFATLTRMVDNTNPDVRQAASTALLKIAPTGKGLGPALMAAVLNRDRACVESLAAALQRSGETRTCLVRLTDLATNDPDTAVRATAHRAVEVLSRR